MVVLRLLGVLLKLVVMVVGVVLSFLTIVVLMVLVAIWLHSFWWSTLFMLLFGALAVSGMWKASNKIVEHDEREKELRVNS